MNNLPVTIPELFTPIPPSTTPPPVTYVGPHVLDLPCPKCGHTDVTLHYYGEYGCTRPSCDQYAGPEHFHRHCRRCSYEWSTNDVLPPDATVLPVWAGDGGPQVGTATTGVDEAGNTTVTARIHDIAVAEEIRRGVIDRYTWPAGTKAPHDH